ncbi:hypothetical protein ASD21_15255 [Caulobacter sp. Root1455]|uniref:zinc ribbon domain-containing protein n=1 Tax=Caulobacter sp. Root1455 TaxID=1736465 RepID=UPI0006F2257A|nr:zinc ribbon domain-containing protein [Caulobacter sp. Root1455]KQY92727.1 hypothetical protein ASD21_15255 [Caulobacter sp. Root1455]
MSQTSRSRVAALPPEAFGRRLLVDCPACGGKAVIHVGEPGERPVDAAARRLVCEACGLTRDQPATPMGVILDPFMGRAPRLCAETRHGFLVAWNEDHLDYLERYLAGGLREETPAPEGGVRNASIVSRLPAWAKAAKNRDEVLKAIARVRREKL